MDIIINFLTETKRFCSLYNKHIKNVNVINGKIIIEYKIAGKIVEFIFNFFNSDNIQMFWRLKNYHKNNVKTIFKCNESALRFTFEKILEIEKALLE
jgi:hypothetical protein